MNISEAKNKKCWNNLSERCCTSECMGWEELVKCETRELKMKPEPGRCTRNSVIYQLPAGSANIKIRYRTNNNLSFICEYDDVSKNYESLLSIKFDVVIEAGQHGFCSKG